MRERSFKAPTARKILEKHGVDMPSRIMDHYDFAIKLFASNTIVPAGPSYEEAVKTVENLESGKIALFFDKFRIPGEDSNLGIKSLDKLVKIDSVKTLRNLTGKKDVPKRITKHFAEKNGIRPYELLVESFNVLDVENPPWGAYWIGLDGHARITTPLRNVEGAEMEVMTRRSDFYGWVVDSKPYGRNLMVYVASREDPKDTHFIHLFNLPISKSNDPRQYSYWINTEHRSNDADSSYRGAAHGQRAFPGILWSAPSVFAYYESMAFLKENPKEDNIRINPFGIPRSQADIDFIDNLRLKCLILDKDSKKRGFLKPLNKTEMDSIISARTILRGYDKIWTHWGHKDFSFLYNPED